MISHLYCSLSILTEYTCRPRRLQPTHPLLCLRLLPFLALRRPLDNHVPSALTVAPDFAVVESQVAVSASRRAHLRILQHLRILLHRRTLPDPRLLRAPSARQQERLAVAHVLPKVKTKDAFKGNEQWYSVVLPCDLGMVLGVSSARDDMHYSKTSVICLRYLAVVYLHILNMKRGK